MSPRGRRPAGEDTRGAILEAAREQFAEHGYDRTSLRGIARGAEVDPRLVHHYFEGGKAELFAETVSSPIRPDQIVREVLRGPRESVGVNLVTAALTAMISDQVPVGQRGIASAWISAPQAIGLILTEPLDLT